MSDDIVAPKENDATTRRWVMVVVVVGALALRLVHVVETRDVPFVRHLIGDAAGYYQWAETIAEGQWIGQQSFYQAPLYPYVLGVLFTVFGAAVWTVRIAQAVWGAWGVWFLYCGTKRLFGRRVGVVAGIVLALYAPAIFFDGIVQKGSLGCVLVAGLFAATVRAGATRRGFDLLVVGVVAGLLAVTRENAMVWLPILLVWVALAWRSEGRRRLWGRMALFAGGAALILCPVALRNAAVSGEFSVSTFQAGPNFYIGNHRGAHGLYQPLVRGHETPEFEREDATRLAEQALGRELTARQVSRYWFRRALEDIRTSPLWWARLLLRKTVMVWNDYEVWDAESQYVYEDYSTVLAVLSPVSHFGVLCALAAMGVVSTRHQWRRLWVFYALIASMTAAVALFYVMARYRFPLVPLLIPFSAAGCVQVWQELRARRIRSLLLPLLAGLLAAAVTNLRIYDERRLNAMAWMNVGVALGEAGELSDAAYYFQRAAEVEPESAEVRYNLAQALALQNDFAGAIPHYQAAAAGAPEMGHIAFNLGVALERVGRADEALVAYQQALRLDPSDGDARASVERLRR